MNNKIIDKFNKIVKKNLISNIKKDFEWFLKIITEDLEKFTKEKKRSKKNE